MKTIGFRSQYSALKGKLPQSTIYVAVLDGDCSNIVWENLQNEYVWNSPRACVTWQSQLQEAHLEVSRIIDKYKPDQVAIKIPEYGNKIKFNVNVAKVTGLNAAIALASSAAHVTHEEFLYSQMKLSASTIEAYVLQYVQRAPKYWVKPLQDALGAALSMKACP